ncbi:hypothetical protein BKA62DRAFT_594409, partial [Auriculariales sp. MPI-PUGE-AT-0066]
TSNFDIVCLQELPIGNGIHVLNGYRAHWTSILPTMYDPRSQETSVRSAILVRSHLASSSYSQIPINSLDLTGLTIRLDDLTIAIFSVYNPCSSDETVLLLSHTIHSSPLPD